MSNKLPVMEHFLSVQGEGHHQGVLSYFIRLSGCDVGCPWCDVKESWEIEDDQWMQIDDLLNEVGKTKAKHIIITGGEPLMHDLSQLTKALKEKEYQIHIETSGAHPFSGNFDWVTLSPKKFKKPLAEAYQLASELKVIVANKKDLEWAEEEASKVDKTCRLYLQAEWDRKERQYPMIYSYIALNPNWKISVQTHKYLGLP